MPDFWSKVDKTATCWNWKGYKMPSGYGRFYGKLTDSGTYYAHRIAYELVKGPIPPTLTIDHLCRNRGCVNPNHLEPVTQRENNLRGEGWSGQEARRTRCPRGHELTLENIVLSKFYRTGKRECRTCDKIRQSRKYRMKRVTSWPYIRGPYRKKVD